MYKFLEKDGSYEIQEFNEVNQIYNSIAVSKDFHKMKEIFHELKRGAGFESQTPNFFGIVNF